MEKQSYFSSILLLLFCQKDISRIWHGLRFFHQVPVLSFTSCYLMNDCGYPPIANMLFPGTVTASPKSTVIWTPFPCNSCEDMIIFATPLTTVGIYLPLYGLSIPVYKLLLSMERTAPASGQAVHLTRRNKTIIAAMNTPNPFFIIPVLTSMLLSEIL